MENEVKAQFQTLWNNQIHLKDQAVDQETKKKFKTLLQQWDDKEFANPKNHYFVEIEKTNSKEKFSELIGGCLSRPYKFPFSSKVQSTRGIQLRTELLSKSTLDERLSYIEQIIRTEIKERDKL